jgi:hypothetical protein
MTLFCDHDWQPRSGYDSGSFCSKCYKLTEKEFSVTQYDKPTTERQSPCKPVTEDDTACWTNTLWS